jgi:predicted Fe-Mo cluster-binding NifX family protein
MAFCLIQEQKGDFAMRVIIPVIDNKNGKNSIAAGFHNAEYVCIYDCASETYEWLPTKTITSTGRLGLELKSKEIGTVISRDMPLMALGVFTDNGLKVLKALGTNLLNNIELFQKNQLEPITAQTSLEMSSCGGSCKSCNTKCN